jgi:hypothetical protein
VLPGGALDTDPEGLIGWVRDGTGGVVASGTVLLVPAEDVAALAEVPIDVIERYDTAAVAAETHDEPLEDLIDLHGEEYRRTSVSEQGIYHFEEIAVGSYFLVWVPDPSDETHLPGGDQCRDALSSDSLVGAQIDIEVSGVPGPRSVHVGSSTCMICHGRHRSMRSAHRIGIGVPGRRGNLQDTSLWPDFDAPLRAFEEGRDLYFYDCQPSSGRLPGCQVSESHPGDGRAVRLVAHLRRDPGRVAGEDGAYYVVLENLARPDDPASGRRYDVALSYGGAGHRQVFITRVLRDGDLVSFVLPIQHNFRGSWSFPSPADWPWREYELEQWFDRSTNALREPDDDESFDTDCAGCHFNGFSLRDGPGGAALARAVADRDGEYDYDGDGRREELNVGCESCHGPGSDHLEASVRGSRIVAPSRLVPGRENMICGRCHSNPLGARPGSAAPLSVDGLMPRPGVRRAGYAIGHTSRVDGGEDDFYPSGDSRSNHQQYSDFMREGMYRNASKLMTCSSCHDPHGSDEHQRSLRFDPWRNEGCTACHGDTEFTSPRNHMIERVSRRHEGLDLSAIVCVRCHMVATAWSGAGTTELLDETPADAEPVQYFHGDVRSHRFAVPRTDVLVQQPSAVSLECATCHAEFLPNP